MVRRAKYRWQETFRNKATRQSRLACRLLAVIIVFFTVSALYYVSTNIGRQQRFPAPISCLSNLTSWVDTEKKPKLHVLLLSYPRSGSSFLGDLLNSYNATFYLFEPLHYFGDVVAQNQFPAARQLIHDLLTCDYRDWAAFPGWAWFHRNFFTLRRNKRYWDSCVHKYRNGLLCFNLCFLAKSCRNYPVQIIKTIRMTVAEASKLLEEYKDLNLKIVHLVRDPRGTMHSRQQKDIAMWCSKYKACSSADSFCRLVDEDMKNACLLRKRHPDKYILVRYEDLALDPLQMTQKLFDFLGLGLVPQEVAHFLETHTQGSAPSNADSYLEPAYRTVRNSTQAALDWCRHMDLNDVLRVQRHCQPVLARLGYKRVINSTCLQFEDVLQDMPQSCETM